MFRGGRRGGGRGGRGRFRSAGFISAESKPHENYPDDVKLPSIPEIASYDPELKKKRVLDDLKDYVEKSSKFNEFWKTSCYNLDTEVGKEGSEISSEKKTIAAKREHFSLYMKLTTANFPAELVQGSRSMQKAAKKLRWDQDSDLRALQMLEKLEEKSKGKDSDGGEKAEDDDEPEEAEEEEDDDDVDEYNQNENFDDDEDDMNQEEEVEEDVYDAD